MNIFKLLISSLLFLSLINCKQNSNNTTFSTKHLTDSNGYKYESVTNDPTGLRLYTLDNGLKVYLSKNEKAPKIQTLIGVRAGSSYDPKKNTGLAHYLEHMMFKGTDDIGTLDFEAENKLLQQISNLYEDHKKERDPNKKKEIYKVIDSVSHVASKLCVANEYDNLMNSLGATGTNAHTWYEETVYKNVIPSNELEKWLNVESERFSKLVLRLFHTELEAVYEEFNRDQDNDRDKQYLALFNGLYPTHPYGTQTTLGEPEHLRNPSMEAIHSYFDTYYIPNNMAVILVGDLDFEDAISKVDKAFGHYKSKEIVHPELPKERPINAPIKKVVYGPTSESIYLGFRTAGYGTKEAVMIKLIDYILANSQAGLIDLNLNQKQEVQYASSFADFNNDYGMHILIGMPKEDQSLEEVRDLLLNELNNVKEGEFEDWIIDAVVNDLKLSRIKKFENATATANEYVNAFIHFEDWEDELSFLDKMKTIKKQEIVQFAKDFYSNNYVEVYKLIGEDKNVVKVESPGISPIELNRDKESDFFKTITSIQSSEIEPQFVNYQTAISSMSTSSGLDVYYVENKTNDLFEFNIIFDFGKDHDNLIPLAIGFYNYLGTNTYTAEALKQEFYKLGIEYNFKATSDKTYVKLSGLKENFGKGFKLLEHLWTNAIPNQFALDRYIDKILKEREDSKIDKDNILWKGLFSYGLYGENSRLRNVIQANEIKKLKAEELIVKVKKLRNYSHKVFYYGKGIESVVKSIEENHVISKPFKNYPRKVNYTPKETGGNVYFVDYDMVQSEVLFLAKGDIFDSKKIAVSSLFNTYFGDGLSSIVFQEVRESKSLAYSAFSDYSSASDKSKHDLVYSYIGTQVDKLPEAIDTMFELMTNMPESKKQFAQAKEATLKKIATQRITGSNIYWSYEKLKKRGLKNDFKETVYNDIKTLTLDDLKDFFNKNIKTKSYNVLVIGNKSDIDFKALSKLGTIKELDVDYLFNYELEK